MASEFKHPSDQDIGRTFKDNPGASPRIDLAPGKPVPWSPMTTEFTVTRKDGQSLSRTVYHPHLCLLKAMKDYCIDSVMDVGCGDGHEVDLFKFLGSEVFSINADPAPGFKADYIGDYMDLVTARQFDLIWCSNVLEHVRNPGAFLDKIYDDLKPGGALALSVPYNEFNSHPDSFTLGHHNRYNFLLLAYQLACAGFDCRSENIAMRMYNWQLSVIIRKAPSGVPRFNMASYKEASKFLPVDVGSSITLNIADLNWDAFYEGAPLIQPTKTAVSKNFLSRLISRS